MDHFYPCVVCPLSDHETFHMFHETLMPIYSYLQTNFCHVPVWLLWSDLWAVNSLPSLTTGA